MNFFDTKLNFTNVSTPKSFLYCFSMATFYVVSLYMWSKQNRFNRNEPSVIQRRFISVAITCVLCLIFIYSLANKPDQLTEKSHYINEWIGFKFDSSLLKASFVSLLGTTILFLGPVVQYLVSDYLYTLNFQAYDEPKSPKNNKSIQRIRNWLSLKFDEYRKFAGVHLTDLWFWRNYVISPFTEEFVFRSCMLPLLVQSLTNTQAILVAPLFFGMAHLHHIIEGYFVNNQALPVLIMLHLFQFSYTYVFGTYSSYLFLRTGNFFASFLSHSFCNMMGFPNFQQLLCDFNTRVKYTILFAYVAGLVMFFTFISGLTEPLWFDNRAFIW